MPTAKSRPPRSAPIEALLRVLADRTRLRLLNLMSGQEICVCYLVEILGASQPKISRHLASLRRAGMVTARRQGKWMHYRLSPSAGPAVAKILEPLQALFAEDAQMRRDRLQLGQACCAPQKFVHLSRAPVPTLLSGQAARTRALATGKRGI